MLTVIWCRSECCVPSGPDFEPACCWFRCTLLFVHYLLRGHRVAVNKSWETLKRSPMPPFGRLVRCSAHGRSRDYGTAFAECRIAVQIGNRYIIIRQNPHNTWWICRPLTSLQLCTLNHTCGLLLNVVLPCYLPPIEQNVGRFKPQTRESGSCCALRAPKITRDCTKYEVQYAHAQHGNTLWETAG